MKTGDELIGEKGLKLKIGEEIGAGGFGTVYLGTKGKKEQYAVKVIMPVTNAQAELSFQKELNAAEGLSHENLLIPIDHGECESRRKKGLFVVYPYCADGNYRARLDTFRGAPVETILADFDQILAGLSALHARLVHRDLKPENIMVDRKVLKIGDFGLTKFVDDATQSLTFKGSGTPLYMAPEVWERKAIGIPADLYAIGVMLFEALTGQPPFIADDARDLQRLHIYEPAPRARTVRAEVPFTVDGVIKKLLDKEPSRRFQTADEVRQALRVGAAAKPTVSPAVEAMRKHHDAEEKMRLSQAQTAQVQNDTAARNKYMEQQVLDMFQEVVEELNVASPEVQIRTEGMHSGEMTYSFANRRLQIGFYPHFPVEDRQYPGYAKSLREQHIVHGGHIMIDQHGEMLVGWNLVLTRPPESQYGEWRFVEVSMRGFSGKSFRNKTAPLPGDEFTKAYSNRRAMDIYNIREHALSRDDVQRVVEHLIPTLVKLETREEAERQSRAFNEDLRGRGRFSDTY